MNDAISRSLVLSSIDFIKTTTALYKEKDILNERRQGNIAYIADIISDLVKDAPALDVAPVVRCKDCANRHDIDFCPMYHIRRFDSFDVPFDSTEDDGFCHCGQRKDGEEK